jgi:hypothetical protein
VRDQVVQAQLLQDVAHHVVIGPRAAGDRRGGRRRRQRRRLRALPGGGVGQQRAQRAVAVARHGRRSAPPAHRGRRQAVGVDADAARLGPVGHVQRHHARQPEALHASTRRRLRRKVGGIDHAHHEIRALLALGTAGQHIAGHALVGRARMQAVRARQVEHPQRLAGGGGQAPFLALDRHAGVVGHLLAAAGEQVEQRRLAAVGLPTSATSGPVGWT